MACDKLLNIRKDDAIRLLKEKITLLEQCHEIKDVKKAFNEVGIGLESVFRSEGILEELELKMVYQDNIYSTDRTRENILLAKEKVIKYLNKLLASIQEEYSDNDVLEEDVAINILKRILNNFYRHIEVMYMDPVNKKAGITSEMLNNMKIVNEYDVQRILYSLIKPIFPTARLEVSNDTGFSTVRYDILIEDYSAIIEVKCSRMSMTEKKLTEEIGSDIFHYKHNNIFFFIYDKDKIVKNTDAFIDTYNGVFADKNINTVIISPILL